MNDLKFAFRQLLKNPGFTAVAVLTLALGIGATTAITSVVQTALFDPLPMAHPDRFVSLIARHREQGWTSSGLNPYAAREAEANTNLFRRVAMYEWDSLTLEGGEFPQPLGGLKVTHDFFTLFGVAPALGRWPSREESLPGAGPVMVLGHGIWQRVFGGDRDVIGRAVRFNEGIITVIGVMPPHFAMPSGNFGYWQAWSGPKVKAGDVPDTSSRGLRGDMIRDTGLIAELQPGVAAGQATAFLEVVRRRHPPLLDYFRDQEFLARDFREGFSRPELRRILWALSVATALVLFIAAANLANLQLARTEIRQQELAVRAALGANRTRLFRQLFAESLLLAALGGIAGLLVTRFGLELLTQLLPAELPRLKAIELDGGVLALSMLVTLVTAILFGMTPAWRGGQCDVNATLKSGSNTTTGGLRRTWFTRGLIVGQVALVLVLLSGAGLMVRSVGKLLSVDVGFDARRVVRLYPPIDLDLFSQFLNSEGVERAEGHLTGIHHDLQQRLARLPGVESVGLTQFGQMGVQAATVAGGPHQELAECRIGVEAADPLQAMRAKLVEGRWLARGDGEKGNERVLVNETAARLLWPGQNAVGQRLWLTAEGGEAAVEVAGVIGDLRERAYNEIPAPTVYRGLPMDPFGKPRALILRTSVHYTVLREAIERELKAAGAGHARPQIHFMEEDLHRTTAGHRTFMRYLLFFAGAGLLLASIGLYGVLAYSVSRRTREIGIRFAVGAQRSDVTHLVLRQGLAMMVVGQVIGAGVSLAATRSLKAFLFNVPAHDPVTLSVVVVILAVVALAACWLPARRAARVEPMEALRNE